MDFTVLFNVFTALYACVAVPGIIGNCVVLVVIATNKSMHTTTNFFIGSMAVSDLVFIGFGVPLNIYVLQSEGHQWKLGSFLCSLFWFLMYMTVLVTCLTMALLAADRYLVFKHPMTSLEYRQPKFAMYANLAVWAVSAVVCSPIAYSTWPNPTDDWPYCLEAWSNEANLVYYCFFFLISYATPVLVAAICYGKIFQLMNTTDDQLPHQGVVHGGNGCLLQRRRRVTVMVTVISICFIAIWAPIHTINLVIRVQEVVDPNNITITHTVVALVSRCLMYLGSCINPVIYAFVGQNFRSNLMNTVTLLKGRGSTPVPTGAKNGVASKKGARGNRLNRKSEGGVIPLEYGAVIMTVQQPVTISTGRIKQDRSINSSEKSPMPQVAESRA